MSIRPSDLPAPPFAEPRQPAPVTDTDEIEEALEKRWADPPGLIGWLSAIQNDAIAGRIIGTAFIFFLIAGAIALVMRLQLAFPENTLLSPEVYNQFFTMHGSTMMYLVIVPMLEGFAILLLPLLLGNRDWALWPDP